ncbi:DNA-3-methyladenine glycosylase II [Pseudomonas cannabina pv. alisalensis]|uniref:DNA-3-methyladenine glycosylase II n=2 Tax=Pseudomonas cannabina TaxID=86840 RepID=A0A3M3PW66_PSECA|nr:DNA-3-methyladenine glycosylase [Pseudomonas cannabina]KPW21433.1 DNA-3-methyladenine glycosylase II [Pseudomonas cannabina pv. alisalensis]MBM0137317.1 DNA-3-methyladenine glycosylase 2 family protein [Pseudomonas cannabina pv. alisalensis]RMN76250.1 DNA-3-methyladenine glycosylase II [Pseudomonas cannabina]RMN90223.1 DNA-3-methyladenine glycosylase II [Pseudomonas cannabina pv. alisalensis]RMN99332.1 DNA-3-methyladenine glycosylase II [Pseudomonas cannabina]
MSAESDTFGSDRNQHTVQTEAPHAQAVESLRAIDRHWQSLIEHIGPCLHPVTAAQDPFQALVKAVAYQQLHARAGDAMVVRLRALFTDERFPDAQSLVALDDQALRSCGFSASKCRAIKAIAAARLDGLVPDVSVALAMSNDELIERLIQLPGVGRWTVEMMLIYGLGQLDVMPASDFGVCEGYRRLYALALKPNHREMSRLAERFAPYRTIAAWYLWRVPTDFSEIDVSRI